MTKKRKRPAVSTKEQLEHRTVKWDHSAGANLRQGRGVGEGRNGTTSEPKPEGFDANAPGPSDFWEAGACVVGPLGRWNRIDLRDPFAQIASLPRNRMIPFSRPML
jgi:hypothetical protein